MKGRLRIDFESLLPLITLIILGLFINQAQCAPAIDDEDTEGGCYYMFNHYGEGDRILTNEPCLNCTCHDSMLMCYLRVCPFTKPIGQDCTIEKKPDQCCPVITCPEEDVRIHTDQKKLLVPVSLVTPSAPSSTTQATTSLAPISDSTELAPYERGCEMNGKYYADGAQVEGDPSKPCELCYCIRNRTACVMQECILKVDGCKPVFQPGVCCPVRYRCDYPLQITDESSTIASVITTTIQSIFQTTPQPGGCFINGDYFAEGSRIPGAERSPCEHCYCMHGEPVCAVQECGAPLENEAGNCTAVPPPPGHCCPEKFTCVGDFDEISADEPLSTPMVIIEETTRAPANDMPSDASTDSPASQSDDQTPTELEPVGDVTTTAPIEPVDVSVDGETAVQADQPDDVASQTVPPTEATNADEKIDSGSSTTSPISTGGDAEVAQEDEDIVQTPTEATIPPAIFPAESQPVSQDQPEIPTEPTIVPGATDGPTVSQDDSPSSTSEPIQAISSTTESQDETIFGTTNRPEPIPSENLSRPSSENPLEPSQDEQVPVTTVASIVSTDTPATAKPVMPDMPEIIDIGSSSEEDLKPSDSPVVTTERPVSVSQSSPDDSPIEIVTTEKTQPQQDDVIGSTSSPSEIPSETSVPVVTTNSPSQSDTQSGDDNVPDVSQDESVPPTTSQSVESAGTGVTTPSSSSVPDAVTTQSPSFDGDEPQSVASDDQSSEAASIPTTSERPSDAEPTEPSQQDAVSTSSPSISDDDIPVQTTLSPQRDATDLPSSSITSIDDNNAGQQDEAVTTLEPESSATDIPSTDRPSAQPQHDEVSTVLPVTSEKPLDTVSVEAEQQTTRQPGTLPDDLPEDNEIVSDQGGETSRAPVTVTSEQPIIENSTENVVTSSQQPHSEGTTISSGSQLDDEITIQSTPSSGSLNDAEDGQTETSQQDSLPGENETEAPLTPDATTLRPVDSSPSQDEVSATSSPIRDATVAPQETTSLPVSDQDLSTQDEPENVQQDDKVTTVAPEFSQERISTVLPPQNDESSASESNFGTVQPEEQPESQQADQTVQTTLAPNAIVSDDQIAQTTLPSILEVSDVQSAQTTQAPIKEDDDVNEIDQDEPVNTTTSPVSVIAADENVQPTTGRPTELESVTEAAAIQDLPEQISPVVLPQEHQSSTQQPEITTLVNSETESSSQQAASTEASSSEALGDEAITEGTATFVPPAIQDEPTKEDESEAPIPTTQTPEPIDIVSDEPNNQDEPVNTTPSQTSGIAADESAQPTTGRPSDQESVTEAVAVQDLPEQVSPVVPAQEQPSSTQQPEITTLTNSATESGSQQAGSTEASSSEALGDEAITEGTATFVPPAVQDESTKEDESEAPVATTQTPESLPSSTESIGIVSDEPIGQDDSVNTTPSQTSGIAADESAQPTTGRPSDLESVTEAVAIQDVPEQVSPVEPPQEHQSSTQQPEITTATESGSQQAGSTEASSSEALGDEAIITEGTTSSVPPVVKDQPMKEDESDAPIHTTQAPESPSADDSSSSSVDSELPIVESSTFAPTAASDTAGDVIGVESVSNSPDGGSESLSMMKTSTIPPSDGEVSSSSATPVDEGASQDNGISSDSTSVEGEQSSVVPPIGSEPESNASTSTPSSSSDEPSSSSAPVNDASSSNDDAEANTPGDIVSVTEVSTEGSTSSQSPDIEQPIEDGNEIIPIDAQRDPTEKITEQPEQPSGTTYSPAAVGDEAQAQEDERPTTVASVSIPSSDATSSGSQPAEGVNEIATTPESQQQEDESQSIDNGSISATSPSVSEEPQIPTTTASVIPGETEAQMSDGKPNEDGEQTAITTEGPSSQDIKDEKIAATTIRPIMDIEGSTTVSIIPNEPSEAPPSEPDQSAGDDASAPATTLEPQTVSQSTPESISSETELPEDSDEIRHPDDNTGDDGELQGFTTVQPDVIPPVTADESQTEGSVPQQDEIVTTQAPVKDEQADEQKQVSSEGTTIRPEADIITSTPVSNVHEESGAQADDIITTEQPISMQTDSAINMMSSTEKLEMDSGSSTTESSSVDDESDSSTDTNIPGEGACFVEGKTYRNGSSIPPTTPCHIACACKNSIVHCLLVHCPPPPARYVDCKPIYRSGVCCPDYDCGPSDETSPVTVTPEPPFADNKDDTVVTVTPEGTSTPSSESLVSEQQQDNTQHHTTESATAIQDQPSEGDNSFPGSSDDGIVVTTGAPLPHSEQTPFPTTVPPQSEPVSSTDSQSQSIQNDSQQDSTEPSAIGISATSSTTTSERPTDIEQIIESSTSTPQEPVDSDSDTSPDAEEQSLSSTTEAPAGSQYPVTTTTTVTPSSAPWPYPTQSTPPPGAMSSGACLFDGRVYMSAQQIPREDPCDFCFCFRGDIICLQQSCPPPIPGCYEEPIPGFCCPRYECPVGNGNHTTPPPLFPPSYYHNQLLNNAATSGGNQSGGSGMGSVASGPGCEIQGEYFETGQVITSTSGPCLECRCGSTGMMECDPRECQPEPMLRKMIAAITSRRR